MLEGGVLVIGSLLGHQACGHLGQQQARPEADAQPAAATRSSRARTAVSGLSLKTASTPAA